MIRFLWLSVFVWMGFVGEVMGYERGSEFVFSKAGEVEFKRDGEDAWRHLREGNLSSEVHLTVGGIDAAATSTLKTTTKAGTHLMIKGANVDVGAKATTGATLNMAYDGLTVGNAAKTTPQLALPPPSVVPNAGGVIRSFVQETDQVYYRVFTDSQRGAFLTSVRPGSSAFAREALALPPQNTAAYIQEVLVPAGTRLQRSRALPAFGRRGGAEQFQLLDNIPNQNFGSGTALP